MSMKSTATILFFIKRTKLLKNGEATIFNTEIALIFH